MIAPIAFTCRHVSALPGHAASAYIHGMGKAFHRAAQADEIVEGSAIGRFVNGWPVMIALSGGRFFATINRCTHAASELSPGRIRNGAIMCPLHGARFNLETGQCLGGGFRPLTTFETRLAEGWIEVAVPDEPPRAEPAG